MKSPIAYGYESADLPVYFNQAPVLNAAGGGFGGFGGGRGGAPGTNPNGGIGQNVTPNALPLRIQPFEADTNPSTGSGQAPGGRGERPPADDMAQNAADGAAVRDHDRRHASTGGDAVLGQRERHAAVRHAASTASSSPTALRRSILRSARDTS